MKNYLFILMAAAGIVVACNKGEVLSPDGQKEAIENTIIDAVSLVEIENWKPTADLFIQSRDTLNNVPESKAARNWDEEEYIIDTIAKTPYPILQFDLSKLKAELTVTDSLYIAESQDLTASWKTADGVECKADIVIKNSDQVIRLSQSKNRSYDLQGKETVTITKEYRLIIPSSITTIVTADGKKQFQAKFTSDIQMDTLVFSPRTDKVSVTAAITSGDYALSVTRAKYSATSAGYQASFKKGSKTIFSSSFSAKGQLAFEDDDDIDMNNSTGTISINGMLMEKVGVSGTVSYGKYAAAEKIFDKSDHSEDAAKTCANAFEKAVKISLYIDGTAQAKLGWEPILKDGSNGEYELYEVVRFTDGSAYVLADDYFDMKRFEEAQKAIDSAMDEAEKYLNPKQK